MPLSELDCEILGFFRETHRKPGARMTMATLDAHFGTDPAVAVAISELKQLGYVTVPDAGTVPRIIIQCGIRGRTRSIPSHDGRKTLWSPPDMKRLTRSPLCPWNVSTGTVLSRTGVGESIFLAGDARSTMVDPDRGPTCG